jgi:23S rRNA (adenine2503-C2)-methyltransferase
MTSISPTSATLDATPPLAALEKAPLERYVAPAKPSLVGLSRAELAAALGGIGVPERERKMRVQQLWHWLYMRGARSFDEMLNISKTLRTVLDAHFTLARPDMDAEQVSVDGTRKWLLRLPPEHAGEKPHLVECVYIPESDRGTLCLSSQVGCTLTCSFCHTGTGGGARAPARSGVGCGGHLARHCCGNGPSPQPSPRRRGEGARGRCAPHHQYRHDGHGRAAL